MANLRIHKTFIHYIKSFPFSALDQLITQDIINAYLRKSICQNCLSFQTRWKKHCAEKVIICDRPTVKQFLKLFIGLFSSDLTVFWHLKKSAVANVFRMNYEQIHQHSSVIKYSKGAFNLRSPLPKLSSVWDVQNHVRILHKFRGQ